MRPFFCIEGNLPSYHADFGTYKFPTEVFHKVEYVYDSNAKTASLTVDNVAIQTYTFSTANPV